MIEFLRGRILKKFPSGCVLDVQGVGYGLETPLTTLCALPDQGEVELWVHTRVREDAIRLFGFLELRDRRAFEVLLAVNGVGPKVALAILSTVSVDRLVDSIERGQTSLLESVPGIGKRTAEKILVELKSRLSFFEVALEPSLQLPFASAKYSPSSVQDALSALENLGFKSKDVRPVLDRIHKQSGSLPFEELVRRALSEFSS